MPSTPIHPGKVLSERLAAHRIAPAELARQIAVPANRISQIINGRRAVTGDTALRLAHWFRTSPEYWMKLQADYDVSIARLQIGETVASFPKFNAVGRSKQVGQKSNG